MKIKNNSAVTLLLNTLNDNDNSLRKSGNKIATGMRINGAGDAASDYVISEKMRILMRGLNQDIKNVQNGQSLLNVALGGVNEIVDELRNLKELALNAANDTNTDSDRAVLQKVFNQKWINIDDIAVETNYNGKKLLDGSLNNRIGGSLGDLKVDKNIRKYLEETTVSASSATNVLTDTLRDLGTIATPTQTTTISDYTVTTSEQIDYDGSNNNVPIGQTNTVVTNVYKEDEYSESVPHNTTETVCSPHTEEGTDTTKEESVSDKVTTTEYPTDGVKVTTDSYTLTETTTVATTTTDIDSGKDFAETWQTAKSSQDSIQEITYLSSVRYENGNPISSIGKLSKPAGGEVTITEDYADENGNVVLQLAEGFSGTINVNAPSVTIIGNGTHNNTFINVLGATKDLYIKNLNIENPGQGDKSIINFYDSSDDATSHRTLHLIGNNSVIADNASLYKEAAIRVGKGGLTIAGNGSLSLSVTNARNCAMLGAGIGSGYNQQCGDIIIDSGVTLNISRTISSSSNVNAIYGAGIGGGFWNSSCGDIKINSNATVTVLQEAKAGEDINAPCIGSGGLGRYSSPLDAKPICGDIYLYSGSNVTVTQKQDYLGNSNVFAAGIGNGHYVEYPMTVHIYKDANLSGSNPGWVGAYGAAEWYRGRVVGLGCSARWLTIDNEAANITKYSGTEDDADPTFEQIAVYGYKVQTVHYTRTVTDAIDYTKAWRVLTGKETIDTTTTVNKYSVKEITTETDPKKAKKYNALVIHHGARANQAIDIHINDMRSKALGIGDASVTTKDKAASSLDIIDAAIDYALDEATTLGAMMMRLEYTAANLTTAHENIQAGESVIRDADMAQAMTDYVKIGVLIQSGQSMLAQANQNASNVLGLLQ